MELVTVEVSPRMAKLIRSPLYHGLGILEALACFSPFWILYSHLDWSKDSVTWHDAFWFMILTITMLHLILISAPLEKAIRRRTAAAAVSSNGS